MAKYIININATTFSVVQRSTISTECADIYTFDIFAEDGDTIDIDLTANNLIDYFFYNGTVVLSNNATNLHYISNGVRTDFVDTAAVTYDTSLVLSFSLENSGKPGFFNNITVNIQNQDATGFNEYETIVTREDDGLKCGTDCELIPNDLGLYPPQLFNPSLASIPDQSEAFTVLYTTDVGFISINGLVIDDSEYSQVGTSVTIDPDNGWDDIDDEILIFQNKA